MYNLKIKAGEVWRDADLSNGTQIATTFEESDIAEAAFVGNGTTEFSLPRTANNEKIFECIGDRQSAKGGYSAYPCVVTQDGMPVLKNTSKLYVLASNKTEYSVTIVGEECDFYDKLDKIDLQAVENERLLGVWRIGVSNNYNRIQGLRYGAGYTEQDTTRDGRYIHQQADIWMDDALVAIADAVGYDINEAFAGTSRILPKGREPIPWYRNSTLPNVDDWNCHAKMTWHLADLTSVSSIIKRANFKWRELEYGDVTIIGVHIRYIIKRKLNDRERFNATASIYNGGSNTIGIANFSCGDEDYLPLGECGWKENPDGSNTLVRDVAFSAGKRLATAGINGDQYDNFTHIKYINVGLAESDGYIEVSIPSNQDLVQDVIIEILTQGKKDDGICWGAECSFAYNLGWKTALDIYKTALQRYARISHVENRSVETYRLWDVISNKPNAVDWTEKLIEDTTNYHSDFCRNNYLGLEKNSVTDREEKRPFVVPDDMLEDKQDYVILPVEAGEDSVTCSYWEETKDDEGHISREKNDPSYPYIFETGTETLLSSFHLIGAYNELIGLLQKYRKVEARMLLTQMDIAAFKHTTPVYLKQYGAYFYVNKISDWEAGQICEVELIKI